MGSSEASPAALNTASLVGMKETSTDLLVGQLRVDSEAVEIRIVEREDGPIPASTIVERQRHPRGGNQAFRLVSLQRVLILERSSSYRSRRGDVAIVPVIEMRLSGSWRRPGQPCRNGLA